MKRPFRISHEEMKEIIELLKEHRSIKKVFEITGRSKRWLIKIAKNNNIKMKGARMKPEEKEKIIALLKEKGNATEVAKIVGRSPYVPLQLASQHKIFLKHKKNQ